jgi:SH3-like domain-containing protein
LKLWPIAAWLAASSVAAADFKVVADNAAVLYDGPSRVATPLYIVTKNYPLEVLVELDAWAKVRDQTGTISWVEKRQLADKRMVVVTATSAEARVRPEDAAPVAFVAAQNVVLELVEGAPQGWLHVRHADGANGYLRADAAWGS